MNQSILTTGLKNISIFSFLLLSSFEIQARSKVDDLPNFLQVNQNIYRGGRPTNQGLKALEQKGIKTIINLEDAASAVKIEKKNLAGTPIQLISIPIGSLRSPKDTDVNKVMGLLNNPQNFTIYIHCQHGQDRTGLMIGLYRVEHGLSPADAYKEMLQLGFHKILFPLNRYFEKRTNFED
jgi:tyrosine-protein phosphatase SIW14